MSVFVTGSVKVTVTSSVAVVVFWGSAMVIVVFVAGKVSVEDTVVVIVTGTWTVEV